MFPSTSRSSTYTTPLTSDLLTKHFVWMFIFLPRVLHDSKYSLQQFVLKAPSNYIFLLGRDQVSYPYKTVSNIIVFIPNLMYWFLKRFGKIQDSAQNLICFELYNFITVYANQ
jgi:hypothetical protein